MGHDVHYVSSVHQVNILVWKPPERCGKYLMCDEQMLS